MNLRDRIRELANAKGMSLPNLESKLGFGNGTIVRWDKASPTAEKLQKVADELEVSVDYLLGREKSNFDNMDLDIRRIQRARQNMPEVDKDFMMDMLKRSFSEYFEDDGSDDLD